MSGIVEDGVVDKLLATSAVTTLTSTRIHPRMAPQNVTKPYAVVTITQGKRPWYHSGASSGKAISPVSVACYGSTYKAARELAEKVELALDAQRGAFGSMNVSHCLLRDQYDASTNPITDDEVGYPCVVCDFEVCHERPTS